jgi:hypothetical protein
MAAAGAVAEEGVFPVQEGFLSIGYDSANFEIREELGGVDLVHVPPGVFERLGKYEGVMVDQPEVWIAEDSPYGGAKPDNLKAIADLIHDGLTERLIRGGYNVVETPGPNVVLLRIALTDLYLKKKKRGLLAYTPIGAATKLAADAVRDMLDKVDIIEMALQAEFIDIENDEVLAAAIVKRGARKDKQAGQKEVRMDFDEFSEVVAEYAARIHCRLANGKLAKEEWVDCLDAEAREAAQAASL